MGRPKEAFDALYACEFYEPDDVMDPELMYTVPEIGRLLQGLDPDTELDPETEQILIDWAVPWIMVNAEDLVIADPTDEEEPGWYGVRTDASN